MPHPRDGRVQPCSDAGPQLVSLSALCLLLGHTADNPMRDSDAVRIPPCDSQRYPAPPGKPSNWNITFQIRDRLIIKIRIFSVGNGTGGNSTLEPLALIFRRMIYDTDILFGAEIGCAWRVGSTAEQVTSLLSCRLRRYKVGTALALRVTELLELPKYLQFILYCPKI